MTLRKRLRVILAAFRQDWHLERCETCPNTWWADRRAVPSQGQCLECEDRHFDEWMQQQTTKEVA